MIIFFLKVTAAWAICYLLYYSFLRKITYFHFNRWYLILTFLLSLMLPFIHQWWSIPSETNIVVVDLNALIDNMEVIEVEASKTTSRSGLSINWWMTLYWLGVLAMGGRFLYGCFQLWRLFRNGEKRQIGDTKVVITKGTHLPFSFFNWVFWSKSLPLNSQDAERMIEHEKAHIRCGHSFDVLCMELVGILAWWSPLIYLYRKALRINHEFMADESVLQHGTIKEYGHLLIKQSLSGPQIALVNHLIHSQLKKRILMMTRKKSSRISILRYLLIVPLAILLVIGFANRTANASTNNDNERFSTTDTLPPSILEILGSQAIITENDERTVISGPKTEMNIGPTTADALQGTAIFINGKPFDRKLKQNMTIGSIDSVVLLTGQALYQKYGNIDADKVTEIYCKRCTYEKVKESAPSSNPGKDLYEGLSGLKAPASLDEEVFKIVEEMPKLKSCAEMNGDEQARQNCSHKKLFEIIYSNIKYPKAGRDAGIQGTEVVKFVIDKKGQLISAQVKRSLGPDFDKEVLRVLKMLPEWEPGKQRGKAVNVEMLIPIRFLIKDKVAGVAKKAENKMEQTMPNSDEVFKIVEEMPLFPGCELGAGGEEALKRCAQLRMLEFIYHNIEYPESGKQQEVQGTAVVKFIIRKDGSIDAAEVKRSLGTDFDKEILRVVGLFPNWIPGKQRGRNVDVEMLLPIKFKLEDSESTEATNQIQKEKHEIQSTLKLEEFQLNPNPASEQIRLQFKSSPNPVSIVIVTQDGKSVYQENLQQFDGFYTKTIDLRTFPKGILILSVQQEGKMFTEQFVHQ